jgi:aryl-alcohol dehydrogenase
MKITAAVVPVRSAPFQIETLELAAPLADELLVRVVASGMCHTDLHARDGYFPNLPYPVVCGHEGAGLSSRLELGSPTLRRVTRSWSRFRGAANATRVVPRASPIVSVPARSNRAAAAPTAQSR